MSLETTYGQKSSNGNGQSNRKITGRPALHLESVDLATWDDGKWAAPVFRETHPYELHEPWPYRFKSGEGVWVCGSDDEWYRGKIVGQPKKGKTRCDEGLFWCVEYRVTRTRVRKWFAPLNGEVKPDAVNTHQLLADVGQLQESDSDE